jgi:putative Holliday junction resolvase
MSKLLGIDYGSKRIGLAVSDENKTIAFSRIAIINNEYAFENILKIIIEENISKIILGYPLSLKSEKTNQTISIEEFRNQLELFLLKYKQNPQIEFFDERLTSKLAESYIQNSVKRKSKRREKGLTDSISAQIILQDYLDKSQKNKSD